MNWKSDIIMAHPVMFWMMWKIRCAAHYSTISMPAHCSHNGDCNIITSASCLGFEVILFRDFSLPKVLCCSSSFFTTIRSSINPVHSFLCNIIHILLFVLSFVFKCGFCHFSEKPSFSTIENELFYSCYSTKPAPYMGVRGMNNVNMLWQASSRASKTFWWPPTWLVEV